MDWTINSILPVLKGNKMIRHLSSEGCDIRFTLYGVRCELVVKDRSFYFGVELSGQPVTELTCKQIAEIMLVLSGEKDTPQLSLFVSENDEPCVFMKKDNGEIFVSDAWFHEYEKLLLVRSFTQKLFVAEPRVEKHTSGMMHQGWMAI